MKTNLARKAAFAAATLVVSLFAAGSYAGPGPQYWANLSKNSEKPRKPAATTSVCPGAQVVDVTTMKPVWANGRGPLQEVKIGTERVCHMCLVTTVTVTNEWANGRGPIVRTETASVGPTHHCDKGCTMTSVASN